MGPIGVLATAPSSTTRSTARAATPRRTRSSTLRRPSRSVEQLPPPRRPSCLIARAPKGAATLVGYALDGFGIYVVKDAAGNLPANAALDACHGTTSLVRWNGKQARIYHYVATLEYPYSVGCFHGTPIATGRGGPPGGP